MQATSLHPRSPKCLKVEILGGHHSDCKPYRAPCVRHPSMQEAYDPSRIGGSICNKVPKFVVDNNNLPSERQSRPKVSQGKELEDQAPIAAGALAARPDIGYRLRAGSATSSTFLSTYLVMASAGFSAPSTLESWIRWLRI